MKEDNHKTISLEPIPNLNTCNGVNSVEVIDFLRMCKYQVLQSLRVQSVDSNEQVDKQNLIEIICKLGKN